MTALNRTTLFTRLYKALKKHYGPPAPQPPRPLLEQVLFACCLENAPFAKAQQAYQALVESYFDWNEVRVSTVRELAETLHMLPEPEAAASHVKRLLQAVFESTYSFDLEGWRKLTLGEAQKKLREVNGVTPFAVAVTTQAVLGGHAIGVDRATWDLLGLLDLVGEKERAAGTVPGLERAIAKNKGPEFFWLLHECAADLLLENPPQRLIKVLGDVVPDARQRLDRYYAARRAAAQPAAQAPSEATSGGGQQAPAAAPSAAAPSTPDATLSTPGGQAATAAAPADASKASPSKARPARTGSAGAAARPDAQQPAADRPSAKPPRETARRKPPADKARALPPRAGQRKAVKKKAAPPPAKRKPR